MDLHRRWFCRECKREWLQPQACYANSAPVSITGNPLNGGNCQVCGSPEIELVEYKPEWPGLDIPRDRINKTIPSEVLQVIPGNITSNNYSIRNEPLLGRDARELIPANDKILSLLEVDEDIKNENAFKLINTPDSHSNNESEARGSIYDNSDMD
jgi:hypothetical protein